MLKRGQEFRGGTNEGWLEKRGQEFRGGASKGWLKEILLASLLYRLVNKVETFRNLGVYQILLKRLRIFSNS
jgi:hypothetical protein